MEFYYNSSLMNPSMPTIQVPSEVRRDHEEKRSFGQENAAVNHIPSQLTAMHTYFKVQKFK